MINEINIVGTVRQGHGKGGKVGARTANLELKLAKNLVKGLYACGVRFDAQEYRGLLYYGINSLVDEDCLEVHVLGFEGELYGKEITVTVGRWLREPKKFNNAEELAKQIQEDLRNSKE